MHKPTEREIAVARRYAAMMLIRGNRIFSASNDGHAAMAGGWRAQSYAIGWVDAARRFGIVNRPLRDARPL